MPNAYRHTCLPIVCKTSLASIRFCYGGYRYALPAPPARSGAQVLDVKLPFSEVSVINDSMAYLLRALKVDSLQVHLATDAGVGEIAASVKVDVSGAYPASPVFGFVTAAVETAATQ